MAIQFNLLPWREAHRQKSVKLVKIILIASAIIGLILSGSFYAWEKIRLDDHNKALSSIKAKNSALKRKLDEKDKLDALKIALNLQVDAIEGLQANRPAVSHMVEELSLSNSQELYLGEFSLSNGKVLVKGVAENDLQISNFMKALEKSEWYQEPKLISILSQDGFGEEMKIFAISSSLLLPGTTKTKDK